MIRRATLDDLDELVKLFDSYRQFYGQKSNPREAAAFLLERMKKNESVVFVAIADTPDKIIGFTQLYPTFSSIGLSPAWILNDLYISREHRNQGYAESLLKEAVSFSESTGARSIMLQTAVTNSPAQKLYEKMGWKRDSEYLSYYFFHG